MRSPGQSNLERYYVVQPPEESDICVGGLRASVLKEGHVLFDQGAVEPLLEQHLLMYSLQPTQEMQP